MARQYLLIYAIHTIPHMQPVLRVEVRTLVQNEMRNANGEQMQIYNIEAKTFKKPMLWYRVESPIDLYKTIVHFLFLKFSKDSVKENWMYDDTKLWSKCNRVNSSNSFFCFLLVWNTSSGGGRGGEWRLG